MTRTFVLLLIVQSQIRRLQRIARYLQGRIDGQRACERPRWTAQLPSR